MSSPFVENADSAQGVPGDHEGTSRSDSDSGGLVDVWYLRTLNGIFKFVHLVLGILCMALAGPYEQAGQQFFLFIAVVCFCITLIFFIIYLFKIQNRLAWRWTFIDMVYGICATAVYFIAFCVLAADSEKKGTRIAAAIFAFFNCLAYGISSFRLYIEWRGS